MIRYRLAQSNAWVYSIQKTDGGREHPTKHLELLKQCEMELQAWIMKMDPTREEVPNVSASAGYDYRNREWRMDATWTSPRRLHDEGEDE